MNVCVMSGDEERVSKRARKNYPGEVSFGALSKEENEHSVAQVSRCTDTGNCTWTGDGTKPKLLGGLGEEGGGGSSLQQMLEEGFGELSFLLGEPQVQYSDNTVQSHWSLVDVPLIFFCPADHVPDWQPRVLLGMVEARSVNVKKTTTTTVPMVII